MVESGRAAEVNVQVDEVRAVGRQVGPGESRGDAEDQQQRRGACNEIASRRAMGAAGAAEVVSICPTLAIADAGPVDHGADTLSSARSPLPLVSVTIE